MLIVGGNNGHLNSIHLKLGSIDTSFKCDMRPYYPFEDGSPIFKPNGEVLIHFNDSHEVDMLIDLLLRFKDANKAYFGEWRLVSNVQTEEATPR